MKQYKLTDDEAALLDGKVNEKAQQGVDTAMARIAARDPSLPGHISDLVADVVIEAKEAKLLQWRKKRIHWCDYCGAKAGYWLFKSGPRRGKQDFDRPLSIDGIELANHFVSFAGHTSVGGCVACVDAAVEPLRAVLKTVEAELPKELTAVGRPPQKRYRNRECGKCGWTGHEGQMGRSPGLMGPGSYPSTCPKCKTMNAIFGGDVVKLADGYTVEIGDPE